jgi:hypothetical protein
MLAVHGVKRVAMFYGRYSCDQPKRRPSKISSPYRSNWPGRKARLLHSLPARSRGVCPQRTEPRWQRPLRRSAIFLQVIVWNLSTSKGNGRIHGGRRRHRR